MPLQRHEISGSLDDRVWEMKILVLCVQQRMQLCYIDLPSPEAVEAFEH